MLFVAMTPNSELKKTYEKEIRSSGLRVKVVERTGRTLKSQLQCSDPFREENCGRVDCFVCTSMGKGNCETENITYKIKCQSERCTKGTYTGESASNSYTRGKQHIMHYNSKNVEQSPMWRHCVEKHGGRRQQFTMDVTKSFRDISRRRCKLTIHPKRNS